MALLGIVFVGAEIGGVWNRGRGRLRLWNLDLGRFRGASIAMAPSIYFRALVWQEGNVAWLDYLPEPD